MLVLALLDPFTIQQLNCTTSARFLQLLVPNTGDQMAVRDPGDVAKAAHYLGPDPPTLNPKPQNPDS